MRFLKTALLGLVAAGMASTASADELLYRNNFDGNEATGVGVLGFYSGLPTEGASAGPWNAAGWAGNYGASRGIGNPAPLTGLNLTNLAPHTTITASFVLGFLESWDSSDGGCCAPDFLDILIDGAVVQTLTYNNALGTVKDTDGNPVLFEYVQANSNLGFSDTLVGYSLTFAHTGSTLDFEFQARGAGWQGGSDEGYGIDNSLFTYDGVVAPPGVPEPATWGLMIAGFGLAGATLRRRRTVLAG